MVEVDGLLLNSDLPQCLHQLRRPFCRPSAMVDRNRRFIRVSHPLLRDLPISVRAEPSRTNISARRSKSPRSSILLCAEPEPGSSSASNPTPWQGWPVPHECMVSEPHRKPDLRRRSHRHRKSGGMLESKHISDLADLASHSTATSSGSTSRPVCGILRTSPMWDQAILRRPAVQLICGLGTLVMIRAGFPHIHATSSGENHLCDN